MGIDTARGDVAAIGIYNFSIGTRRKIFAQASDFAPLDAYIETRRKDFRGRHLWKIN
jgi:hypothetical protein